MKRQTVITKKKRGPKPTGQGELIGVRIHPPQMKALDVWIKTQPEPRPSRPEAIRRLVELGLAGAQSPAPRNKRAAATARKMARATIDEMTDTSAPPEEQAKRKRRLIKGPREFRELRGEKPKG
jgi:hypothetical protein